MGSISTAGSSPQATEILSQLTIEQKVSLLAGHTTWRTAAIPEFQIPAVKLTDGPNGARGESIYNSTTVCFPCGASLGASWDTDLVKKVGREIAREAKTKNAQVLLGPTMNIHRSPLHGRNFESFSEDPTLTGHLAAAYISGCQSEGISACPKHFIANEVEKNRTSVDTIVSRTTLREIYLKAFQIMLQNSDPWCLMTSYNKVNHEWCSQDPWLLQDVLRGEWGYKGCIVSDWFGTYSDIAPIKAGLNLEMPGPTKHRGAKTLAALKKGLLTEQEVDRCALPVLELAQKLAPQVKDGDEICDIPDDRIAIARQGAAAGIVLLKNDNSILPIDITRTKKIAIIGNFADEPAPHGGGSASVRSSEVISPLQALRSSLPDVEISVSAGVQTFKKGPCPSLRNTFVEPNESSQHGTQIEWFDGRSFTTSELLTKDIVDAFNVVLIDPQIPNLKPDHCLRLTTYFRPEKSMQHTFALTSSGPSILYIDGEAFETYDGMNKINEDFIWQPSKYEKRKSTHLEAGRFYKIVLEAQGTHAPPPPGLIICPQGCRTGIFPTVSDEEAITEAIALAKDADLTLVFVGNSAEYESEGFDRETIALSRGQDALVTAIAVAQPKTVVINQSGAPVAFPWSVDVPAILQVFFSGQEVGNAVADVLLGNVNPSGKLPVSFPARIEDSASFENFPGSDVDKGNSITYAEGQGVGYRHFLARKDLKPAFAFGFGLSYTTFQTTSFEISSVEDDTEIPVSVATAEIKNTGDRVGSEILQIYVLSPHGEEAERSPNVKVLRSFKKIVDLQPGEIRKVSFELDKFALSAWSESAGVWEIKQGTYNVFLQNSSVDTLASAEFKIGKNYQWGGL